MAVLNSDSLRAAQNAADSQIGTTAGTDKTPITLPNSPAAAKLGWVVDVTGSNTGKQDVQTNPLNDYDSYTYCLSLHLLSINEYNDFMQNPDKVYYPQNVLVSSAGRHNVNFVRNRNFTEDFYFDDFKMTTIVNTTNRNRSSNLIDCSFTLIEPLGFTFINRLLAAADQVNGSGNYLLMPYVIQIDFFGYKDGDVSNSTGVRQVTVGDKLVNPGPIDGMTKIIPVMLTELKSRVTTRGTEYSIQAVPYNHHALNQVYITSPASFEITAKTVQSVFGSGTADINVSSIANQRAELEKERRRLASAVATPDDGRGGFGIANSQNQLAAIDNQIAALTTTVQSSGFADALNGWWKGLVAKGSVLAVNRVSVIFDEDIANATLYPTNGPINIAQANSYNSPKNTAQAAAGQVKGQIDFNSGKLSIPAGMTIDKLVDWAVRNSSYIGNQLSDPTSGRTFNINERTKPLNWYKIVPRVKILSFDQATNRYSLDITYYVKSWTLSAKNPYAPQGRAPGFVKNYEWFYTGKNKDVLDMQIDFDMLYYNELQAFRNKSKLSQTAKNVGDEELKQAFDDQPDTGQAVDAAAPMGSNYKRLTPVTTSYVSNRYMQGRAGVDQSLAATAADVQKSFTLSARGDMVNLKLRIIGDPHFIKQDDMFYLAQGSKSMSSPLTANNSLWMDNGELYIRVLFDTPADYDETIGLAIPGNSMYSKNEFSGIYKLITVTNEFTRGKFEQVLDLAWITIEETTQSTAVNAVQRLELAVSQRYTAQGFKASRFSGPSILVNNLTSGGVSSRASILAGGAAGGAASGLVNSIVGQVQQAAGGAINKAVNDVSKPLIDKGIAYAKDTFNKIKDELGFGSTSTLGSGGGADGAASHSGAPVEERLPEQSAMNQASQEWNSDSTDAATTADQVEAPPELAVGDGVDGSIEYAGEDFGGGDFGGGDFFG